MSLLLHSSVFYHYHVCTEIQCFIFISKVHANRRSHMILNTDVVKWQEPVPHTQEKKLNDGK